jgi:hypothetical protein
MKKQMDNYYLLLGGLAAGLVLSQTVTFLGKAYQLLVTSDQQRDKKFQELTDQNTSGLLALSNSLEAEIKAEHKKQWDFLKEKANVLDQKLSLVLTKVTCTSTTATGNYQTSIAQDAAGANKLHVMAEIVDEVGGAVSNNYKDLLAKFGERKEKLTVTEADPNPKEAVKDFQQIFKDKIRNVPPRDAPGIHKAPKAILAPPDIEECDTPSAN